MFVGVKTTFRNIFWQMWSLHFFLHFFEAGLILSKSIKLIIRMSRQNNLSKS